MTMINSNRLRIEPVFTIARSALGPQPQTSRRRFVCAHQGCGKEFIYYHGMRHVGSGVGLCPQHNVRKAA